MSRFAEEQLATNRPTWASSTTGMKAGQMNYTKMDARYNQKKGATLLALAAGLALAVVVAATQDRDALSLTASVVPTASSLPSTLQAEQAAVVYIVASEAKREALATPAHAGLPAQPVILVEGDEAQAFRYLAEIQAGVLDHIQANAGATLVQLIDLRTTVLGDQV